MIDNCPSFEGGDCEKKSKMALSKKTCQQATKKKKLGADFGAALVKARQDTDHIFKQASEDEGFSNSNSADAMSLHSTESNSGRTDPRCKAAAWAWHQRGGGGSSAGSPENVRNRALVVVRRSSRFKAEALRINASYTAEDTVIKAEHKWDPNQSLFDSYELLSVARELDKALNQHVASSSSSSSPSSMKKSRSSNSNGSSSSIQSGGVDSAKPMGRLLRLLPAPVLCLSEDDVATTKSTSFKKKHENNRKNPSVGSSPSSGGAFEKISKAIQLLRYSPPADSNEDAEEHLHHHEHFHHHHHHHHHHVDVLRRS